MILSFLLFVAKTENIYYIKQHKENISIWPWEAQSIF
jgi:hypothetical protein